MQAISPPPSTASKLETLGFLLMCAYVMVLPIGHTMALRNLLFLLLIATTLWLAWQKKIQIVVPFIKPWLLYTAVAAISLIYAVDLGYSLGEIKTELGYGFLAFVLGATWTRSIGHLTKLLWAITACNLGIVIGSFYYTYPLLTQDSYIQSGSFNIGVGKLSTYIVLEMPFIMALWWVQPKQSREAKIGLGLLILGNIAALYFTGNRAGVVALLVEAFVLVGILLKYQAGLLWKRKIWLVLVASGIMLGALAIQQLVNRTPASTSISSSVATDPRWVLWDFSLQNIASRPLTGGGFGLHALKLLNPEFPTNNPALDPTLWHAHNTLLNVGIQTGIPGIIAFIILMLAALYKVSAPLRETTVWEAPRIYSLAAVIMFAGLAVKLQTDDFFGSDIALFFWLTVGALSSAAITSSQLKRLP